MVPWVILANAKTFLNFMSAYAVFMGPIAGIMLTDYWFIKKRKIDVPALYDPRGIYGTCVCLLIFFHLITGRQDRARTNTSQNWRSLIIMILVIIPMLPALANKVTPDKVHIPKALSNLFAINWLYGFVSSCVIYYGLNVAFPDKVTLIDAGIDGIPVESLAASGESTDGDSGRAEKGLRSKEAVEVGA